MKFKFYMVSLLFNLTLFSTAHSQVLSVASPRHATGVCATIRGLWFGRGTLVSEQIPGEPIKCDYQVIAVIDRNAQAGVELNIISGICSSIKYPNIPVICDDISEAISLQSSDANLSGVLEDGGVNVSLNGTINILINGQTVTATAEKMHIGKFEK